MPGPGVKKVDRVLQYASGCPVYCVRDDAVRCSFCILPGGGLGNSHLVSTLLPFGALKVV